jgi:hypothetical protein
LWSTARSLHFKSKMLPWSSPSCRVLNLRGYSSDVINWNEIIYMNEIMIIMIHFCLCLLLHIFHYFIFRVIKHFLMG